LFTVRCNSLFSKKKSLYVLINRDFLKSQSIYKNATSLKYEMQLTFYEID
jgi:hypothetical protein